MYLHKYYFHKKSYKIIKFVGAWDPKNGKEKGGEGETAILRSPS